MSCTYEIDYPEYQVYNSMDGIAVPGKALNLEYSKTDAVEANYVFDSLFTILYSATLPNDTFSTESNQAIRWSSSYRIHSLIPGEEELDCYFQTPDSLSIEIISVDSLTDPIYLDQGRFKYKIEIKLNLVEAENEQDVHLNLGAIYSNSILSFEATEFRKQRKILANELDQNIVIYSEDNSFEILYLGPYYFQLASRNAQEFLQNAQVSPVSISNVEGGVGIVDFYYSYPISF